MKTLNTLIVDDDVQHTLMLVKGLEALGASEVAGSDYGEFSFTNASNQQDADRAAGGQTRYDLVLLDLRYPLLPGQILSNEPATPVQGLEWLPCLRRLQPEAAIVILTSYAKEGNLQNAVRAIRDGHANDFIPKTSDLVEIAARIRLAIVHARRSRTLVLLDEEYQRLLRSHGTRIYADDIGGLVQEPATSLMGTAMSLQTGDASVALEAAEEVLGQVRSLQEGIAKITERFYQGRLPILTDCRLAIRPEASRDA